MLSTVHIKLQLVQPTDEYLLHIQENKSTLHALPERYNKGGIQYPRLHSNLIWE